MSGMSQIHRQIEIVYHNKEHDDKWKSDQKQDNTWERIHKAGRDGDETNKELQCEKKENRCAFGESDIQQLVMDVPSVRAEKWAVFTLSSPDCGDDIIDGNWAQENHDRKLRELEMVHIRVEERRYGDDVAEWLAASVSEEDSCIWSVPEHKTEDCARQNKMKGTDIFFTEIQDKAERKNRKEREPAA